MIEFMKQFIKSPLKIGAILPSSNRLARRMIEDIDFSTCQYIVEYGPGTGVFTKEIMKRKSKDAKVLLIEQNQEFFEKLANTYKNDPNVKIVNGSAELVEDYLKENQIPFAEVIISGIPFTSLPKEVTGNILKSTENVLKKEGRFITFQYSLVKKHVFEAYFKITHCKKERCNFPPAYVLVMQK